MLASTFWKPSLTGLLGSHAQQPSSLIVVTAFLAALLAALAALPLVVMLAEFLLEVLVRLGVVGIVVWLVAVLLVVELLGPLLGLVLRLLLVVEVLALGLGEVVYASTGEASKHLLGETVVDLLA